MDRGKLATETPIDKDFNGLRALKANAGKPFTIGILLYLGNQILSVEEDLYMIPLLDGDTLTLG